MLERLQPLLYAACLALLFPTASMAADNPANPLITDRGLFRPLIIVTPNADDPDYQRMRERLETRRAAFKDREMLLYNIESGHGQRAGKPMTGTETHALLQALDIAPQAPLTVILVGKDGGKKMQLEGYVPPQQVFDIIDKMPMRQAERTQ